MRFRFTIGAAAVLAVAGLITSLLYQPGTAQEQPRYEKVSVAAGEKPETPASASAAEPPAQAGPPASPGPNTFAPPIPGNAAFPGGTVSFDNPFTTWYSQRGVQGSPMLPYSSGWSKDPEAQKLTSEDQQLESEVLSLVRQLTDNSDDKERADLTKKLQAALEKQFDAQQKLREHEISRIEARVQKLRDLVRKRTDSRRKIIDNRYEQLLNDAEGLGWNSTSGSPGGFPAFGTQNSPAPGGFSARMAVPGYPARPVGPLPQLPAGKKK